uniref:Uncharacterized protein n=1 Tax=Solanum lycopersicum TaxID=4081 RepID=A0A3Q7EUV2_SOLLC
MDVVLSCSSHFILLAGHCNAAPVLDPYISKVTTTDQHSKKRTATSLDASNCRYPLRSKKSKDVKIEKEMWKVFGSVTCSLEFHHVMTDAILLLFILLAGHCTEALVALDPSTSKVIPLISIVKREQLPVWMHQIVGIVPIKQLKEVKIEKGDVRGIWFSNMFFVLNYVMMDDIILHPPLPTSSFFA